MGTLRMTGKIHVSQFWPEGQSDADTANLQVEVSANAFEFRSDLNSAFVPTTIFYSAFVKGSDPKPKAVISGRNIVKVRLQGIDAPELHYRLDARRLPKGTSLKQRDTLKTLKAYREFRQPLAESASVGVGALLSRLGGEIPCEVVTQVDQPNDVFDTYGRFVGDVIINGINETLFLNIWLVEQGWAYPAFYSSMSHDEIEQYLTAAKMARTRKPPPSLWRHYSRKIGLFDESLTYRRPTKAKRPKPDPQKDAGPVLFPKLFRRFLTYSMCRKAGIIKNDFASYLANTPDDCFLTKEFLDQSVHSAQVHYLHEFVEASSTFNLLPQDLVFREKPSKLVDSSGRRIENW